MRIPVRKQVMWWGVAAASLAVTLWLLGQAVLPFILGAGVAYLLDPVADRLERAGLSRTLAVVVKPSRWSSPSSRWSCCWCRC